MYFVFDLKRFFFLVSVCLFYFGPSTAQTNRRDSSGVGTEDYGQGSYFFYQSPDYPRDCQEVRDQCSSSVSSGVYLIKPDGYSKPFEVYCNNDVSSGGWTVIQRRLDGSITFGRNWEEYKTGFGFPSSEFWVGNERLSFLTNQNVYELRVDISLSDNTSFHINYNKFRISDEWGKFGLSVVGTFTGDADYTPCPQNTVYGDCTCVGTCEDPLGTSGCPTQCNDQTEACVCQEGLLMKGEQCVSPSECDCYVSEQNRILQDGETSYNTACTEKCSCNNGLLSCENVDCSPDATCKVQGGVRQCYCNEGYSGNGETCTRDVIFRDCNDVRDAGNNQDGVYSILPTGWTGSAFNVFCNMTIDGGGWTVFQRRNRGATDFYRNWSSYKNGFGNIQDEFWLGNDKLHVLTQQGTYELRVDFVTSSNSAKYAKYSSFQIDAESTKYSVTSISGYSGNGYDGMGDIINEKFSTFDQDNDDRSGFDCAEGHRGGWWYWANSGHSNPYCQTWRDGSSNRICSYSNPNGDYNGGNGKNIYWLDSYRFNAFTSRVYCRIKYTEMKIRRTS